MILKSIKLTSIVWDRRWNFDQNQKLTTMPRKALVIGINEYHNTSNLKGCVNDALDIARILERHTYSDEKEKNFTIELMTSNTHEITSDGLRDRIEELFKHDREVSLIYFSGHGYIENTGGYLITSECKRGDHGVSMNDILFMANESPATNRIIILDCCNAGGFGRNPMSPDLSSISEGVTVLCASSHNQYAIEKNGQGVFTSLLIYALEGGAANILGEISAGNIYGYIDKAMGEHEQRPIFMTNIRRYVNLRRVASQIGKHELRQITKLFNEGPDMLFQLDPCYEPDNNGLCPQPDQEKMEKFALLQKFNRVNLVVPDGAPHMFHAAMESKSCKLTALGKSYWVMVYNDII